MERFWQFKLLTYMKEGSKFMMDTTQRIREMRPNWKISNSKT